MRRFTLASLFAILVAVGGPQQSRAGVIDPGFDLFQTLGDGSSFVDLSPFGLSNNVALEGNKDLLGPGLYNTDTIVARKDGINPFDFNPPGPDSGMVDIELIALSLKSVAPVDLTPLGGPFVGVNSDLFITRNGTTPYFDAAGNPVFDGTGVTNKFPNLPQPDALALSTGTMTITHDNPDGVFANDGTFTANFPNVFADAIFTTVGGDPNNPGDILISQAAPAITLSSTGGWTHTRPSGFNPSSMFPAGKFYITDITHTGPHPPIPTHNPEPGSLALLSVGLAGFAIQRRRKKKQADAEIEQPAV